MSDPGLELAQRIMGFMVSAAVYVAAKLDVAGVLGDRTLAVDELADATRSDVDALYRVLRLLAAHGIFVEAGDRSFANTESSRLLGGDFRDFALVFGEEFYPAFNELLRTVHDRTPAFEAFAGKSYYEYLAADPDASTRFNRFMAAGKAIHAEHLAAAGWRGGETVIDVGGGNGALLIGLLERRPDLRGVVFDLPHVTPEAEERVRIAGLTARCQVVAGDFFEGVPPNADAYVLSAILHGWDRDGAAKILQNVRRAIAADGRVFLFESVVAPPNEAGGKLMDVLMLAVSGGRERTEDEWKVLLRDTGFELVGIAPPPAAVLEAVPR
jgi:SAM-dependent methyltransferase